MAQTVSSSFINAALNSELLKPSVDVQIVLVDNSNLSASNTVTATDTQNTTIMPAANAANGILTPTRKWIYADAYDENSGGYSFFGDDRYFIDTGYEGGWWSNSLSNNSDGTMTVTQVLTLTYAAPVTISEAFVYGDSYLGYPVNFTVKLNIHGGGSQTITVTGNLSSQWVYNFLLNALAATYTVDSIVLTITKISKLQMAAVVLEFGGAYVVDATPSTLVKAFTILQERSAPMATVPTGAVSAGTLDLTLANTDASWGPSNAASPYYPNLKTNRKILISAGYSIPLYPAATVILFAVPGGGTTVNPSTLAPFTLSQVIQIDSEQMQITAIANVLGGPQLTVTRGYNSTTPAIHNIGASILIVSPQYTERVALGTYYSMRWQAHGGGPTATVHAQDRMKRLRDKLYTNSALQINQNVFACVSTALADFGLSLGETLVQAADAVMTNTGATLTGSNVSATATVIQVTSYAPFAVGMIIQVDNEEMLITAFGGGPGDTLTVTRSYNGTLAGTHTIGAAVFADINTLVIPYAWGEPTQTYFQYLATLAVACGGVVYVNGNNQVVFRDAAYLMRTASLSVVTLTDANAKISNEDTYDEGQIKNRIAVAVNTLALQSSQVIFSLPTTLIIPASGSLILYVQFANACTNVSQSAFTADAGVTVASAVFYAKSAVITFNGTAGKNVLTYQISGQPLQAATGNQMIPIEDTTYEGLDGTREFPMNNPFIQNSATALILGGNLLAAYKQPPPLVHVEAIGLPWVELGDRITLNSNEAAIVGDYFILRHTFKYDGDYRSALDLLPIAKNYQLAATKLLNTFAYYPLNDTIGSTALEVVNAANGTYNNVQLNNLNGPGFSMGGAPFFDGLSAYVQLPSAALNASFDNTKGTLAGWVYLNGSWATSGSVAIACLGADANNRILVWSNGSGVLIQMARGGSFVGASVLQPTTGAWHHIGATWDTSANQIICYLDGVAGTPQAPAGVWSGSLSNAYCTIGGLGSSSLLFPGWIEGLLIANRAFTASEMALLATPQ